MKYLLLCLVLVGCVSTPKVESPVPNRCYLQPISIYKRCSSGGTFVGIESYSQPNAQYVCCFESPQD